MTLEEYQKIKRELEKLQRERDMAEGQYKETMTELKKRFNCKTVEEAERQLVQLQEDEAKLEDELEELELDFQKKWGDKLEVADDEE